MSKEKTDKLSDLHAALDRATAAVRVASERFQVAHDEERQAATRATQARNEFNNAQKALVQALREFDEHVAKGGHGLDSLADVRPANLAGLKP